MPPLHIDVLDDASDSTPSSAGFIRVRRLTMRATYEDGTRSEAFRYDVVDRDALDAVLMLLHAPRADAPTDPLVVLRTAMRPPLAMRAHRSLTVPDARTEPLLWELPAGLIEANERGEDGMLATAARETEEETGYVIAPERFARLGAAVYLSPGLCAEKIHVVHATVDPAARSAVTSTEAVEHGSRIEWVPLSDAIARADRGEIEDCKTELALRRFAAQLAAPAAAPVVPAADQGTPGGAA